MSIVSEKAEKLLNTLAELYPEFEVRKLTSTQQGVQLDLYDMSATTWDRLGLHVVGFMNDTVYGPRWNNGTGNPIPQDKVLLTVGEYLARRRP